MGDKWGVGTVEDLLRERTYISDVVKMALRKSQMTMCRLNHDFQLLADECRQPQDLTDA